MLRNADICVSTSRLSGAVIDCVGAAMALLDGGSDGIITPAARSTTSKMHCRPRLFNGR